MPGRTRAFFVVTNASVTSPQLMLCTTVLNGKRKMSCSLRLSLDAANAFARAFLRTHLAYMH